MTTQTLSLVTATLLLTTNAFAQEIQLEDISIITATKTTQNISDITSNVDVITSQEIEDRGFTTVSEALSTLPGISFTRNGGLGQTTSVNVRGMSSKSTLVLIDGIRYNDVTGLIGAPFAHLMISDIEQIEVVKGAQSGIWGADAAAGVINIITKKPEEGLHGAAHIEAGSFKTSKYGATLSQKTDAYSLKVSHNVVDTDGFTSLAPKDKDIYTFEDDGYKNKTTNIQLGININETNKIDLSYTLIDAEGEYDTFNAPNSHANTTTKDSFTSINFNHVDSFNELNIYANRSKFERKFNTEFSTSPFDGQVDEFGFNSKIPYGEAHFVLVGADYKKFEHKNSIVKDFDNKGIFVTNHNKFAGFMGGTTILTESLRYDSYSTFDNELTGKIGLKHIHENIEGLVTSLNYGTAYTVPTLYQLYAPGSTFGGFFYPIGNENLQPETTESFDVTVAYKDFSLSYFDTTIDNLIEYTSGYNNVDGESKINGIEASYSQKIYADLLLSMNYTHLFKAEDINGKQLIRRAEDTFNASVDYYGIENFHAGVAISYVGSRTDIIFNPDFSTSNAETGKYTVLNLTADYQITNDVQVYGKIENLTDETYQTIYGFATSPRAFYAGLRAKF